MPERSSAGRIVPIASLAAALSAIGLVAIGRGEPPRPPQDPPAPKAGAPAPKPNKDWYAVKQCGACHRPGKGEEVTSFVRLDEINIWRDLDKHSKAFTNLDPKTNEKSRRMADLLGWDLQKDGRCLSCHAPAFDAPKAKEKPELVTEGVSCSGCHGPDDRWIREHGFGQEDWIKRTAADKFRNWGMNDLRDPAVRSAMCASCHVGDASQGRVVTHEIYAAGHPPLPGLEVSFFSEAEPPHWWPMKDVPYLKNKPEALKNQYGIDQAATQHAKLVAVGGVVDLRESMTLFADTAKPGAMPDFARFDCASCHHELKESRDSWRQAFGFPAEPGRPPSAHWPAALARIGIAAGDPAQAASRTRDLDDALAAFRQAVGDRPFGDDSKSVAAARKLASWADGLAKALDSQKFDRASALRMLRKIAETEPRDYASARQLVWGFRSILKEMDDKSPDAQEVAHLIDGLMLQLGINLIPRADGGIERALGARLEADDRYDPASYHQTMDDIAKRLNNL